MGEDDIISSRDRVYKFESLDPLSYDLLVLVELFIPVEGNTVNASRANKLEKSHDPLALVAHTRSSSRNTTPYYVIHPSSMADYDNDYQGDAIQNNSEDPLTSTIILLARAITKCFSNLTNNRLRTSSNTRNQAIVQGNATNVQCYNYSEKGHYARNCPKPRFWDSKYFMEQMLLAKQDEAGVILTDEQNDFLFADALRMEEIEELRHYMTVFLDVSRKARDKYHNLEDDAMVKNIFNSRKHKEGVGMKILSKVNTAAEVTEEITLSS
uniref:CCHC-type domain-containing protein n=1 Tax=Tanacetum cinerariifolium TaxID=118510 RepID=A0A6L2NRJ5_TANCI|nr:hypothetical protein [Tanacetum cinerariifolium]